MEDKLAIWTASVEWNDCPDVRPWLLLDDRGNGVHGCFPISTQDYRGLAFLLSHDDADFEATGLDRECYVHWDRIFGHGSRCCDSG